MNVESFCIRMERYYLGHGSPPTPHYSYPPLCSAHSSEQPNLVSESAVLVSESAVLVSESAVLVSESALLVSES